MPLHKVIFLANNTKLYLWKITEDLDALYKDVKLKDSSLERLNSMKAESHKKGFLAVRKLLQHIDYDDFDLYYDAFGKPHLKGLGSRNEGLGNNLKKNKLQPKTHNLKPTTSNLQPTTYNLQHISISHSHAFSAIAISETNIGIDIEILKDKILKIAPRFMDILHLEHLSEDEKIKKATVIWGIKESIFKIKNEIGISFNEHIFEEHFDFEDKKALAKLKFNTQEEDFMIQFDSFENYMFVCAFAK